MVRRLWVLGAPVLLLAVIVGCSGRPTDDDDPVIPGVSKKGGGAASSLTPVKAAGKTTLKGRVVLAGEPESYDALKDKFRMLVTKDVDHCLRGTGEEIIPNTWIVDRASKGVKYVFVWLRPVDDKAQFFDVKDLVDKKEGFDLAKSLDQPHCAFVPHALVLFPRYIDPANPSEKFNRAAAAGGPPASGQKFVVQNSAPIPHNTNGAGRATSGGSVGVPPDGGQLDITNVEPSYTSGVQLSCSIHPWMQAYAWAFPHPFAAVTNEKGEFSIPNAPAGVPVRLVVWHEAAKFVVGEGGKPNDLGKVVTLKEGTHTEPDITVAAR